MFGWTARAIEMVAGGPGVSRAMARSSLTSGSDELVFMYVSLALNSRFEGFECDDVSFGRADVDNGL